MENEQTPSEALQCLIDCEAFEEVLTVLASTNFYGHPAFIHASAALTGLTNLKAHHSIVESDPVEPVAPIDPETPDEA